MISQFRIVTPDVLNCHGTLFGGTTMKWMDEIAYIAATRLTRQVMVTVSVDKVKFFSSIKPQTIVEITVSSVEVRMARLFIVVEVFCENMYSNNRLKAAEAIFTFAAVGSDEKPLKLTEHVLCSDF